MYIVTSIWIALHEMIAKKRTEQRIDSIGKRKRKADLGKN